MNTHSEPCPLCGRIGCASPQMNQPGRQIDVIGTHWRLGCLERQVDNLRKRVEEMQPATIQPDSRPATVDDRMVAELEQWRKSIVWHKDSAGRTWSLIVRSWTTLSYVMTTDGEWIVGGRGKRYPSRDAAMRAAEAAFGLPKCSVEGEP